MKTSTSIAAWFLVAACVRPGSAAEPPVKLPATSASKAGAGNAAASTKAKSGTAAGALSSADFALDGATRSLGGAGAPTSVSPYMIGDFFVSGGQLFKRDSANGVFGTQIVGELPNAGASRRVKISENNSPIPRDRVFYSFNEFVNALPDFEANQLVGAMDIDRHTPGFEKTFWDGIGSFELRTPIAYTQNSRVFIDGDGPAKHTEFGNLSLALKFLLWQNETWAFAGGLGLNVPTADDVEIYQFGDPSLIIRNESVHLLPYVGFLWQPTDLLYVQSFLQLDVDANGNTVLEQQAGRAGVLNEQTLLYFDVAVGYWLYQNMEAPFITGITPTLEFHYTTTLQDADLLQVQSAGGPIGLGNIFNRLDIVNATAGLHVWLGPLSVFTVAGGFPLGSDDEDRQFDAEIIAQFNRFF